MTKCSSIHGSFLHTRKNTLEIRPKLLDTIPVTVFKIMMQQSVRETAKNWRRQTLLKIVEVKMDFSNAVSGDYCQSC